MYSGIAVPLHLGNSADVKTRQLSPAILCPMESGKKIETVRQFKRCIVKARVLTGTYTLQAHRAVYNKNVDPT